MIWRKIPGWTLLALAGFFLLSAEAVLATTQVVPPGGSIADALATAQPGDTVLLECGVYREQDILMPEGVILSSETGQAGCVTILTDGSAPAFRCLNLTGETRLEGLIIKLDPLAGDPSAARGGGVFCESAAPVFMNCRFEQLTAAYGGAVYCREASSPVFENCVFRGNRALAIGGALACVDSCRPTLTGCLVAGNTATSSGGAFNAANESIVALDHCTVVDNESVSSPAMSLWNGSADTLITGSIMVEETLWLGDAGSFLGPVCSNVFGPDPIPVNPFFSDIISADPMFCVSLAGDNHFNLDAASPCTPEAAPACEGMGAMPVGCAMSPAEGPLPGLPRVTRLQDVFPNPFNPRTTIEYEVSHAGHVGLSVFDLAGRLVSRLVDGPMPAGRHQAVWTGTSQDGRPVAAGVYFVRLKSGGTQDTRQVTLVK
jgi:hypothetical protein